MFAWHPSCHVHSCYKPGQSNPKSRIWDTLVIHSRSVDLSGYWQEIIFFMYRRERRHITFIGGNRIIMLDNVLNANWWHSRGGVMWFRCAACCAFRFRTDVGSWSAISFGRIEFESGDPIFVGAKPWAIGGEGLALRGLINALRYFH